MLHYYPQFLNQRDSINLQVIFPGGWTLDLNKLLPFRYLIEPCLLSPSQSIHDPDKHLWEICQDYWTITSYESIRINFTLKHENLPQLIPILHLLTVPRTFDPNFVQQELDDLKSFWLREKDLREDQAVAKLFDGETIIHPHINNLKKLNQIEPMKLEALWNEQRAQYPPKCILLGSISEHAALESLNNIFNQKEVVFNKYLNTKPSVKRFQTSNQWGIKISQTESTLQELFLIEYLESIFNIKFYFEYHGLDWFIWTNTFEYPLSLTNLIINHTPTEAKFHNVLERYLGFLEQIYQPKSPEAYEKLAEIIEGLHQHPFQAPTKELDDNTNLDLRVYFKNYDFDRFKDFFTRWQKTI